MPYRLSTSTWPSHMSVSSRARLQWLGTRKRSQSESGRGRRRFWSHFDPRNTIGLILNINKNWRVPSVPSSAHTHRECLPGSRVPFVHLPICLAMHISISLYIQVCNICLPFCASARLWVPFFPSVLRYIYASVYQIYPFNYPPPVCPYFDHSLCPYGQCPYIHLLI